MAESRGNSFPRGSSGTASDCQAAQPVASSSRADTAARHCAHAAGRGHWRRSVSSCRRSRMNREPAGQAARHWAIQ
eukprot:scaffold2151_cov99-Isochrysis_galbana.AAC.6